MYKTLRAARWPYNGAAVRKTVCPVEIWPIKSFNENNNYVYVIRILSLNPQSDARFTTNNTVSRDSIYSQTSESSYYRLFHKLHIRFMFSSKKKKLPALYVLKCHHFKEIYLQNRIIFSPYKYIESFK